jgi:pimeloyl-ACP methyl ester carboxylesterase
MALVGERPKDLPPDPSRKETIEIISPSDGCQMKIDIYSPSTEFNEHMPLLLAPHPITWTAAEDYHGGLEGLMREYHRGYYGLAEKYKVVIAMPHGHHHKEDLCSVAGPEQIDDMNYLIDGLGDYGYKVDKYRVYVCGLSMGGQEALVIAGKHPDRITAVFAFNPIVDLTAWHEELATSEIPEIREYDTAARIANEVGGSPSEAPEAYAQRSATTFCEGLSKVPTMIFWSDQDLIVPRQVSHHTYLLYQRVKEVDVNSPFAEYNHTRMHGPLEFNQLTRWQLHEWTDYDLALRWLLCHQK